MRWALRPCLRRCGIAVIFFVPIGCTRGPLTQIQSIFDCALLQVDVASGRIVEVESVIQREPDLVTCRDRREWTPLHYAASNGQARMVRLLLEHGAALTATNDNGATPLHDAAY